MEKKKRHPLNAEGDFFVEYNACISCDAPCNEAPELMAYDEDMHCYFKRQPQTPEETEHAINAVCVSCIEGVLYEGNDPEIIKKLSSWSYDSRKTISFGEKLGNKLAEIMAKLTKKKGKD